MAVRISLKKFGTKHRQTYRVCVYDDSRARDGKIIEEVGIYNTLVNPPIIRLEKEKIAAWIKKGARPTLTVGKILKREGVSLH